MSKTLDQLEAAIHGTPSGYTAGCRSRGGCPNRADRRLLTCKEARVAYSHYLPLARRAPEDIITRAELKTVRARTRE